MQHSFVAMTPRYTLSTISFGHSAPVALLLLFMLLAYPVQAQDRPRDSPGRAVAGTAFRLASNQSSPFSPGQASDERFIANAGSGLDTGCTFSSSGDLVIELDVTRYVGTVGADGKLADADALISAGLIPPFLRLQMPAYDVDYNASIPDFNPERDRVYFNGKPLGFLKGSNNRWERNSFKIDIGDVKFAKSGGGAGKNEIRIAIDTANSSDVWCTAIDWVVLGQLDAWRPALLLHGWNGTPSMWQTWRSNFQQEVPGSALPLDARAPTPSLDAAGSVPANGQRISGEVQAVREQYGVDKVNIVAHSKGGLDARYYVATHSDVEKLIMLATPNAGSPLGTACKWATTVCETILAPVIPAGVTPEEVARAAAKYLTPAKVGMQNRTVLLHNPSTSYIAQAGDWRVTKFGTGPIAIDPGNPLLPGTDDAVVQVGSVYSQSYMSHLEPEVGLLDGTHFGIYKDDGVFSRINDAYLKPRSGASSSSTQGTLVASAAPTATTIASEYTLAQTKMRVDASTTEMSTVETSQQPEFFEGTIQQGEAITHALRVDASDALVVQMYWADGEVDLELATPSGDVVNRSTAENNSRIGYYESDGGPHLKGYRVSAPEVGTWTLRAIGQEVPAGSVGYAIQAKLEGSAITLSASTGRQFYHSGEPITVEATLQENGAPLTGAVVQTRVVRPDSSTAQLTLHDDGAHGDGPAGDGLYAASLEGTDPAGSYDFFVTAERTSAPGFSRQAFTQTPVSKSHSAFGGTIEEATSDADGDGLADELLLRASVQIDEAGRYFLGGRLAGPDGTFISSSGIDTSLSAGSHTLELSFSGRRIYQSGKNGPYRLERLSLSETGTEVLPVDIREDAYETNAYSREDFERPSIYPTGEVNDTGVDTDGDGLFDYLDVEVEFDFLVSGTYEWTVKLADSTREEVETVGGSAFFEAGRQTIRFRFDGEKIGEAGAGGPYYVQDILLYRRGGGASFSAFELAKTHAYSACDFEGTVCDTTPPEVALAAPATLWPPNHQYVSFAMADMVESVTDSVAGAIPLDSVRIASVSSDEPENGHDDGDTADDIVIADDSRSVQLRRERQGGGNGRVYTVNFTVSDPSGNVAEAAYRVSVPHDQDGEAINDGPAYTVESGADAAATTAAAEAEAGVPAAFALKSPYPNPARGGRVTLPLELPQRASVRVEAFDALGRRIRVLAEEHFEAGRHPLVFEAARLASGLYLVRAIVETTGGQQKVFTAKVTVVR